MILKKHKIFSQLIILCCFTTLVTSYRVRGQLNKFEKVTTDSFGSETTECNSFLYVSDSLGNNYNDKEGALRYFQKYKSCLKKHNTANASNLYNKIKDYDLMSLSRDKKGGWGYIKDTKQLFLLDSELRIIKPIFYSNFGFFGNEHFFPVLVDSAYWNFADLEGRLINNKEYQRVWRFSNGLACVKRNNQYGFINVKGVEVIPVKYSFGFSFSEGFAGVAKDGMYGFIDTNGRPITAYKYTFVHDFKNGFAIVETNGRFTLINKKGKELSPLKYSTVRYFNEGLARVGLNGKYGYIDSNGKEAISLIYSFATDFDSDGYADVELDGKSYRINKRGEIIR